MGKILVLEDEDSVNRGISFSLEKAGHKVCSCKTIRQAKKQARIVLPDIVICDIYLPDGSGLDFIRWLRHCQNAYIICLTARNQETEQVMGYEAGADDYVTKPFSLSILLLKIEAYLKRNAKEADRNLIISEAICVSQKEMRMTVSGQEVSLSKNEWKLLLLFLNHPRQILSKTQILEHVFDTEGGFVDENTLAVNIRRLREKIEKQPAKPEYIKNIRGIGYVWDKEVQRVSAEQ